MNSNVLVSAFEENSNYGGGIVTNRILKIFDFDKTIFRSNNESKIRRIIRVLLIWIRIPWLHPIFCAYSPKNVKSNTANIFLNFSQCFNMLFSSKYESASLIVHDVMSQKRLPFNCWVVRSEKKIFNFANKIYVISSKDKKLLTRFYKIPVSKIVNIRNDLFPDLRSFNVLIHSDSIKCVFIGSLQRSENFRGFEWFYHNILPHCKNIEVDCIGITNDKIRSRFKNVNFLGFVDNLVSTLANYDISVAPLLDGAGIKIKVVDALSATLPVLGTPKAFEGIGRPSPPFCSLNQSEWIEVLNSKTIRYKFISSE